MSQPPKLKPDEFQCHACKRIFRRARSDEEAMKEAVALYGPISKDQCQELCSACYEEFMSNPLHKFGWRQ